MVLVLTSLITVASLPLISYNMLGCYTGSRNCSDIVQDGPHYKFHDKDPTFLAIPGPKIWDQEVKKSKAKGTPSILKFLKRPEHSCSQLKHEPNGKLQTIHMPTCSGGNMHQNTENAVERENWSYDVDEIDPTIVDELPADIQEELRGWLRPLKQRHSAKSSSITSYFLPSKDSSQ